MGENAAFGDGKGVDMDVDVDAGEEDEGELEYDEWSEGEREDISGEHTG
jgi:hypothetical protein